MTLSLLITLALAGEIAPGISPGACVSRTRWPESIQTEVGPFQGHSGLSAMGDPKTCVDGKVRTWAACHPYPIEELGQRFGTRIRGYMSSKVFLVQTCMLEDDATARVAAAEEEAMAHARSAMAANPDLTASLEAMTGTWCGRAEPVADGFLPAELRLDVHEVDGVIVASTVSTWPRSKGGPLGDPDYVSRTTWFPVEWTGPGQLALREVGATSSTTRQTWGAITKRRWTTRASTGGLAVSDGRKTFEMGRSCDGFWSAPDDAR